MSEPGLYRRRQSPIPCRDRLALLGLCFLVSLLLAGNAFAQTVGHTAGYQDVRLEYETLASREPTLVFVHGWLCDRTYWRQQQSAFTDHFGVVLLDLGGHGGSGDQRTDWTIDGFAQDVVAVLEALDLRRVILVGHSMGGPVIAEAARRAPERVVGLIGVDTYQYLEAAWLQGQGVPNLVAGLTTDFKGTTSGFVRQMFTPASDTALSDSVLAGMTAGAPAVGIPATKSMFEWYRDRGVASLNAIDRPIWTINSAEYVGTDAEELHRLVPSIELRLMEGVGHFVMLEDPDSFNSLLLEAARAMVPGGP